jgi:hypothetical protein
VGCVGAAAIATRLLGVSLGLVLSWGLTIVVVWLAVSTFAVMRSWWPETWEEPVSRIARTAGSLSTRATGSKPDIYYIVLDGMARADVLEKLYGIDAEPALSRLKSLGVKVPSRSRSNYSQTQLSLASALNLQYLSDLGPVMGDALDRRPLNRLIVSGGIVRALKAQGYESIVVGSNASITSQHRGADRCYCRLPDGPTELEHALMMIMPLRGLSLDRKAMSAHRRQVAWALELIEAVRSNRPMFVLTHVVSPHPPFVFASDGTERIGQNVFTYFDGDGFPGTREEYVTGYRQQATFILNRMVALIERIVARSPDAIIVVHSDHGPGLGLVNTDTIATDARERLAIFSAYYDGGRSEEVPDDISPVNALRWALRAGLQADIPLLPNRSYLSDYLRPYLWHEIPAESPKPAS